MAKVVTISEAASIGLHAMILVAKSESLINVVRIADATSSSKHHVAKVMQRLVKENYLDSQRGPNGGFSLRIAANDITLLQIYEAIEGKIEVHECPLEKPICPFGKCILNNITNEMTVRFREYLNSNTLADYID
jgi:Rrf2 family protein